MGHYRFTEPTAGCSLPLGAFPDERGVASLPMLSRQTRLKNRRPLFTASDGLLLEISYLILPKRGPWFVCQVIFLV